MGWKKAIKEVLILVLAFPVLFCMDLLFLLLGEDEDEKNNTFARKR
jgi:hypothetical protein